MSGRCIRKARRPLPPATSVHVHRRDGRGGDLIQDATYVTGDVHEALFIHQNEGPFLEGRYSELQGDVCDTEEELFDFIDH